MNTSCKPVKDISSNILSIAIHASTHTLPIKLFAAPNPYCILYNKNMFQPISSDEVSQDHSEYKLLID